MKLSQPCPKIRQEACYADLLTSYLNNIQLRVSQRERRRPCSCLVVVWSCRRRSLVYSHKIQRGGEMSQPATSPKNITVRQSMLIRNFTGAPLWISGTFGSNLGSCSWVVKTHQGPVRRRENHFRILLEQSAGHDTEESFMTNSPQSLLAQWTIPIDDKKLLQEEGATPDAQPDVHQDMRMVPPPPSSRPKRQGRLPER